MQGLQKNRAGQRWVDFLEEGEDGKKGEKGVNYLDVRDGEHR